MKKILLHVGTFKTGSTTIQQTLFQHRNVLARHDIHYLSLAPCHEDLCWSFWAEPWNSPGNKRAELTKDQALKKSRRTREIVQVEIQKTQCDWIIISAEQFSQLRSEQVTDVVQWLSSFGEVQVVYFVRRIESHLASEVQQAAKNGVGTNAVATKRISFWLTKSPRNWRDAVGRGRFALYRFEDAVESGLTNTLLESAGLSRIEDMGIKEKHLNQSISGPAVACLQQLNSVAPLGSQERNPRLEKLLQNLPGDKYRAPNLTEEQVNEYNKKMQNLHELCGIDSYPLLIYQGGGDLRQPFSTEAIRQLIEAMNESFNQADRVNYRHRIANHGRHLLEQVKNFVRRYPRLMRFAYFVRGR